MDVKICLFFLYKYLKKKYEHGEPIFAGDIAIPGLSDRFLANYPLKIYKAIYETGVEYAPV